MNKRNTYIPIMIFLLCITAAPSFYLFSSYSSRRIPAGKRPQVYTGPRNLRQKLTVPVAQPAQVPAYTPATVATRADDDQETNQTAPEPQAEPTAAAQSMQAKAAPSSPGMLMTAYIVLLSTLNKAFGTGIELSYKPLMENWRSRQEVLNARNEIPNNAKLLVESGAFDKDVIKNAELIIKKHNISEESPEYKGIELQVNQELNLPKQQKIAITTERMLMGIEPAEKKTSFGSIASQTLYLTLFNTATRLIGGIIGLGATMLLQSLMPTEK